MKIHLDELEKITSLLLSRYRESNGNEIELNNDYYWDIAEEEAFNPYEAPNNISLGQFSDDYTVISRLLTQDDAIPYDLKRLANILRALSVEKVMW